MSNHLDDHAVFAMSEGYLYGWCHFNPTYSRDANFQSILWYQSVLLDVLFRPKKKIVRFRFPTDPAQLHATQKFF